jgi:general secretion pathway protein J
MKNKGISHAGFTLLEVIVSLTLISLVTLVIGGAFRLGNDAWKKGEQEILATQKIRALSGLLLQHIKSAYPYEMEIDDEDVLLFQGEKNSIMFVTTLADPFPGGFKWMRFAFKDGLLTLSEGMLPDKKFPETISQREEVIDSGLGDVQFEHYSPVEEEWDESWESEDGLPQAVRVNIKYYPPFLITIPMSEEKEKSDNEG